MKSEQDLTMTSDFESELFLPNMDETIKKQPLGFVGDLLEERTEIRNLTTTERNSGLAQTQKGFIECAD